MKRVKVQKPKLDRTVERVRDISEQVYRARLGSEGVKRMLADDEDDGMKLRARASSYDQLTRVYMSILKVK
jgi:NADPH-dependent ferric siderophore reductase